MSLATFGQPGGQQRPETLSRTVAAGRLGVHPAHLDKMIRAGMLAVPITTASIEALAGRSPLRVLSGELTVLRTDARRASDASEHVFDGRQWIGFHVSHTDQELGETSLRWWRSDPARVLDNELLAVTVATFPVAVYRITEHKDSMTRPDEDAPRHHYAGDLLARVTAGMMVTRCDPMPGYLNPLVDQIMASRISVNSGGPVGYLEP